MQRDSATYVDEPEDAEDFAAWRASSFSMSSAQPDIDNILSGKGGRTFKGGRRMHMVFLLHGTGAVNLACFGGWKLQHEQRTA
jgi:ethanolamine utilization protein EutA (predicted chaperonin)